MELPTPGAAMGVAGEPATVIDALGTDGAAPPRGAQPTILLATICSSSTGIC